jgi:hypothetical protein
VRLWGGGRENAAPLFLRVPEDGGGVAAPFVSLEVVMVMVE